MKYIPVWKICIVLYAISAATANSPLVKAMWILLLTLYTWLLMDERAKPRVPFGGGDS